MFFGDYFPWFIKFLALRHKSSTLMNSQTIRSIKTVNLSYKTFQFFPMFAELERIGVGSIRQYSFTPS